MFQIIEDDIKYFSTLGNVITCGDFNSRLGNCSDSMLESAKDNSFLTYLQITILIIYQKGTQWM